MRERIVRICMTILGVAVSGLSVGIFKHIQFGTDPFQSFINGIYNVIPISFGVLYSIINAILLLIVFFVKKHYIGFGTIINLFFVGYIIEFTLSALQVILPNPDMLSRIILLAIVFVVFCAAAALYITADLGVSPYDAISLIMADKKVAKFQYCRIATDIVCVVLGLLLGAVVGVGTVMTAFLMGPFVAFFRNHITDPLLAKVKN